METALNLLTEKILLARENQSYNDSADELMKSKCDLYFETEYFRTSQNYNYDLCLVIIESS